MLCVHAVGALKSHGKVFICHQETGLWQSFLGTNIHTFRSNPKRWLPFIAVSVSGS